MRGFFLSCHVSVRKLMISFDRWRALALPSHWSTRELPNCSGRMCWAFGHDYLMSIVQWWHDYTSSNSQVFREKSAWEEVCVDSLAGNSTQQMWWVLIQLTCFHGKHFTTQVIAWMWNEKVYSFSWHDTVRKLIVSFDRCLPVPSHRFTQSLQDFWGEMCWPYKRGHKMSYDGMIILLTVRCQRSCQWRRIMDWIYSITQVLLLSPSHYTEMQG